VLNVSLSLPRTTSGLRPRRNGWLLVWMLLVAGAAQAAKTGDSVRAWRDHDAIIVQAHAELHAPLQTAWRVLTDYGRYAAFIPDLKSSRVLSRSGNTAIVEQKGEAGFFFFHFPLEVTFTVTELPDNSVSSRAIAGTFKEMTGNYELTERDGMVRFTYNGRIVPAFNLPPLVGVPALRAAVERQFLALAREIRRAAASARDSNDER
jgi:ribosome-associated toxin RatA of RatAB toxin-antitoxin module